MAKARRPAQYSPHSSSPAIQLSHQKTPSSTPGREYDVAVVFSQDQDLSEVAIELRRISREQGRWIQMISAFPYDPADRSCRGIDKTTWFRIDQELYNTCIDPYDYRN